jgi:hypothetical protein
MLFLSQFTQASPAILAHGTIFPNMDKKGKKKPPHQAGVSCTVFNLRF